MAIINAINMPNFTHDEIPANKAKYMDRRMLVNIQKFRDLLGCPFSISKANGALIRFDGSPKSEHYVSINKDPQIPVKLSKAVDGFPDGGIFRAWTIALSSKLFGGVGVYFDTKNNKGNPQPMLHLDLRPKSLLWFRLDGEYYYPHKDKDFFDKLEDLFEKNC